MMKLMVKTLLAATALAAFSGGAMAADLAMPAAQPAPFVAPATTNWDGPYIGATVGYGWASITPTGLPAVTSNGWLVGAQLGYNFHLADQIVAGIQGNVDWNNENITGSTSGWDGAIVARLGYDVDSILPYVEAGVAFLNAASTTSTGFTVGAGVEFMLADQLSANVEYRYSSYGAPTGYSALSDNQIRFGLNYHF
jgi:outer membrane immunogenic protein